jgi:hypothetical protein
VRVVRLDVISTRMARSGDADEAAGAVMIGERDELAARDDVTMTRRVADILKVISDGTEVTWRDKGVRGSGYAGSTTTVITDQKLKAFAQTLHAGDEIVIDVPERVSLSVIPK